MKIILIIICMLVLLKMYFYIQGYLLIFLYSIRKKRQKNEKKYEQSETKYVDDKYIRIKNFINGYMRYIGLLTGKIPSHTIRMAIYKYIFLMDIEANVVIYGGAEIRNGYNIKIGKGTIIGDNCILDGRNGITIGENVNFSSGVWIWTEEHDIQDAYFRCNLVQRKQVVIGNYVWLGGRTVILPGVVIEEGAVVASGAVVTKDIMPHNICGGVPAKVIGKRSANLLYNFDGGHQWFY